MIGFLRLLLGYIFFTPTQADPIALGALGAWTIFEPDLLVALVAANWDFRKNFEAPVQDRFGPPIVEIEKVHQNLTDVCLWIGTTHAQASIGISTAIDMMFGLTGHQPVVGLIGASTSSVSAPIATVSSAQKVPQISFSATSAALSNKASYPFFLRTLPPDSKQASALFNWLLTFEVQQATVIYSRETYGEALWAKMQEERHGSSVQISGKSIRDMSGNAFSLMEAQRVVTQTKEIGAKFIVLCLSSSMLLDFVNVMKDEGMLGSGWQVIGSDSCSALPRLDSQVLPAGFMYFDFVAKGALFSKFEELWKKLDLQDIVGFEASKRFQLQDMRMPLDNASIQRLLTPPVEISTYAAFAFDAYYAFLIAINSLLHQGEDASSIKGDLLLQTLLRTNFTGVSGDVRFDEKTGDRILSYELWNLQSSSSTLHARVVAEFSSALGTFTFRDGEEVTWIGGSKGKLPPFSLSECNPGFFYSRMTRRCMPCQKGQYCKNNTIYLCERGHFAKESASDKCTPCAPGSHAPDVGMVECIDCIPGFYANNSGSEQCDKCDTGKYMNASGGTACTECGLGQITKGEGSTSSSDCRCNEGNFMCPSSGCMKCPDSLNCTGEGAPQQKAGFWTSPNSSQDVRCEYSVLRCRNERECPAGPIGTCSEGREGLACNYCLANHYPSDGVCLECVEQDIVPTLLLFCGAALLLLAIFSSSTTERLNLLTAAAVTSQVIMAVQALASIRELAVNWPYPVRRLIDLTRLLTLNFDIIRLGCIYGTDSPALKFLSQLLVCPIGCAGFFLLGFLQGKLCGRPVPLDRTLSRCGMLLFALFLSITLRNLLPFQCAPNPDGSTSMVSHPGIICYASEDHVVLLILALVGLLQPLSVLCWATFATITFPARVASGRGLRLVNRYRFLFHRFKPSCFYYGLFLLYRNGLIALLPVVFVEVPELQVPLMGALLLISMALQSRKYPWRTAQANHIELLLTGFLLVILLAAAPLLDVDQATSAETLGWLLCVPVIGLVLPGLFALSIPIWLYLKPTQKFGIFLCHHKAGAGSLCRLIKILMSRHSKAKVFLDCDQLENLDFLFDVVRSSTKSIVVVLTPELLKRVWCAGEIATAYKNSITTVPLLCDGFRPMGESLQVLASFWGPEQMQMLANHGISLVDVQNAYLWMQQELSPLRLPRFGRVWRREAVVVDLLQRCELPSSSTSAQIIAEGKHYNPNGARILITSCITDAEALSTCEAFQCMLQAQLHVECAVAQSSRQMERWRPRAYYLVVLLFRGVFQDQRLGRILSCAFDESCERNLEVVTVIADTHFDFVGLNMSVSQQDSWSQVKQEEKEENTQMTQAVYKRLLNVIALPFSPLASDGLQRKQVAEISSRFHRYKDLTTATIRDAEDDQVVVTSSQALSENESCMSPGVEHFSGSSQPESPECPYLLTTTSFPSELSEMEGDTTKDSESDAFSM